MRLPGPFEIYRVQDLEWPNREIDFLLRDVTTDMFAATVTAADDRFVNVKTGQLRMSFHSFVIRTAHGIVLVDTCIGNHKERPMLPEWHLQQFPYLERLAAIGLTPADIDFVCCTHLHADHVGWNTRLVDGEWVPTFPNARYLAAKTEFDYWSEFLAAEPEHFYGQSWRDSVLPVVDAGLMDQVASDAQIVPGIKLQPAYGHTPGNCVIHLDDGENTAVMSGDVMHHPVQIEKPDWCSVFDDDPARALVTRRELLAQLVDTQTWVMGAHFTGPTAIRVRSSDEGYRYE